MEFFTKYVRPLERTEVGGGLSKTETAGYMTARVQIEQLLMAGKRLDHFRRDMFDFPNPEDDDGESIDPTRSPNFDMADASTLAREVSERLRTQKERADARAELDEKKAAEGTEAGESDPSTD